VDFTRTLLILLGIAAIGIGAVTGDVSPTVTQSEREAFRSVAETAPPEAVLIVGPPIAVEWAPYMADRPIPGGRWGAEWTTITRFHTLHDRKQAYRSCVTPSCLQAVARNHSTGPIVTVQKHSRANLTQYTESTQWEVTFNDGSTFVAAYASKPSASAGRLSTPG